MVNLYIRKEKKKKDLQEAVVERNIYSPLTPFSYALV